MASEQTGNEAGQQKKLSLIYARSRNHCIGKSGQIPWRLPADFAHFKQTTIGKPIIMGRKTWDSLPRKPLPGRANFVISRSVSAAAGASVFADVGACLDEARGAAIEAGVDEVCLIGGAQLYADLLPKVDRIYLTEVDLEPKGDAGFPALSPDDWREVSAEAVEPADGDDAGFTLRVLDRVGTS